MRRIDGDAKSIRSMLGGSKFAIDYYQREYRWKSKQVAELLDDLAEKFLESHEPGNERSAVEQYGHYFLGSIIISHKDGQKFIIDGQQRLTSTTLLLIHLHRQLRRQRCCRRRRRSCRWLAGGSMQGVTGHAVTPVRTRTFFRTSDLS